MWGGRCVIRIKMKPLRPDRRFEVNTPENNKYLVGLSINVSFTCPRPEESRGMKN